MTKKELCRQMAEKMLDAELLNEEAAFSTDSLLENVEQLIYDSLEDFALVYEAGIIKE